MRVEQKVARLSFTLYPCNSKLSIMKRVLTILLLMFALTLRGEDAGEPVLENKPALVKPAPIVAGEKLMLYSYNFLGVEVSGFEEEEYQNFRDSLEPCPIGRSYRREAGKPASLLRSAPTGLIITRVVPGSPAESCGLKVGDIITHIGGADMSTPLSLLSIMRNVTPGVPMFITLIDSNRCWKFVTARPIERPEPVAVGHIIPRKLCSIHEREMRLNQARAIQLLAMEQIPVEKVCQSLEAICRIIYRDYTPGSLRIPLRADSDCTITATRNGWNIDVVMEEKGITTKHTLRRWMINSELSGKEMKGEPDRLPEPIRQRLLEMDTYGAEYAPDYDEPFSSLRARSCCNRLSRP